MTTGNSSGKHKGRLFIKKAAAVLFSIGPLVWIYSQVSFGKVYDTLHSAAWWLLPMVVVSSITAFFLQGFRWAVLLRALDRSLPYTRILNAHFKALYYSMVLPSSAAQDVVRALIVSQETSHAVSWGAAWICRLIGLAVLVAFSLYGFFSLDTVSISSGILPALLIVCTLVIISSVLSFSKGFTRLLRPLAQKIMPSKFFTICLQVRDGIYAYRHKKKQIAVSLIPTFLLHVLVILTPSLLLKGIVGKFYFFECLAFIPVVEIISMTAPLTPNNIGIREGLAAVMLNYLGLTDEQIALYVFFYLVSSFMKITSGVIFIPEIVRKIFHKRE